MRVSRGGGERRRRSGSSARPTGRARSRASAIRARGCSSSGSRPRHTAAIAPAACSPAIARATGCTARSTARASRTSRRRPRATTGCALTDAYVACIVRCAPPDNKPTPAERDRCLPFLARELALLPRVRAILALGAFAWDGVLLAARELGHALPKPRPKFGARRDARDRAVRAARQLPRQPAEHVHRPAHRADARRGVRARPRGALVRRREQSRPRGRPLGETTVIDFGGTCDLAVWCKRMRDQGWSGPRIARELGKSEGYVNNLIRVVERASPAVMARWKAEQAGELAARVRDRLARADLRVAARRAGRGAGAADRADGVARRARRSLLGLGGAGAHGHASASNAKVDDPGSPASVHVLLQSTPRAPSRYQPSTHARSVDSTSGVVALARKTSCVAGGIVDWKPNMQLARCRMLASAASNPASATGSMMIAVVPPAAAMRSNTGRIWASRSLESKADRERAHPGGAQRGGDLQRRDEVDGLLCRHRASGRELVRDEDHADGAIGMGRGLRDSRGSPSPAASPRTSMTRRASCLRPRW